MGVGWGEGTDKYQDRVSCILDWSQSYYTTEDDLTFLGGTRDYTQDCQLSYLSCPEHELLIICSAGLQIWPGLCGGRDQTQNFVHARQALLSIEAHPQTPKEKYFQNSWPNILAY